MGLSLWWNRHGEFGQKGWQPSQDYLMRAPKNRRLGDFFLFLAEMQYWTYSPVERCLPTTNIAVFWCMTRISEYGFWFSSFRFGGILFTRVAPDNISVMPDLLGHLKRPCCRVAHDTLHRRWRYIPLHLRKHFRPFLPSEVHEQAPPTTVNSFNIKQEISALVIKCCQLRKNG